MIQALLPPCLLLLLLLLPIIAATSVTPTHVTPELLQSQLRARLRVVTKVTKHQKAVPKVERCTNNIVRAFFGVHISKRCCSKLTKISDECYHEIFAGSPLDSLGPEIIRMGCRSAMAPCHGGA